MTLYTLEGLLARIAGSGHRDDFVLKGGVLLAAFDLRRPTKDIDLQAIGLPNDVDLVLERVRSIALIDLDDGLVFDEHGMRAQEIRDEDEYSGVRVRLVGALGRSRLTVGIDINFGDPIWPHPQEIELPRLVDLGQAPLRLRGYPLAMVIAEKAVTAIERGTANTRWRDFADVLLISTAYPFAAAELRSALEVVANHRDVELRPLLPMLESMPAIAETKWSAWRRRQARGDELPATFAEALAGVAAFLDPVLSVAQN
ncbi:nucleotidyl transferase AbiEii/AbiGii toxin family protein [Kribbella albertanoniae]|uniref:Nucleotidyl transferase AbiEii/AbiGii toxin family protein n=1 Tax=Kribbella albertanoniae TaxID=1266829 RepID=A0A4R4PI39_9ACTN|nr:nucleotidyl transferase AbiEii/AbiGii toxin family protein [Kribbella albertanoniae]